MIEYLCQLPHALVMGGAALIGAGVMAGVTISRKKKKYGMDFELNYQKLIDTTWQSILVGASAGLAIGCSGYGIIIAALSGYGIDKLANKLQIKEKKFLNITEELYKIYKAFKGGKK